MKTTIGNELEATFEKLQAELLPLDQQRINTIPFAGSWTPAQVADHLLKSYALMDILDGNTIETKRPLDEKAKGIRDLFLNMNIKFEADPSIQPATDAIDKLILENRLSLATKQIVEYAHTRDLSPTCLDFELPGFGVLTRLEWLHFIVYHTIRHTHQLTNMKKVNKKLSVG